MKRPLYLCHFLGLARDALILFERLTLKRVDEGFIAAKQMLHPVTVTGEGGRTIEAVNREVERAMRLAQIGGHGVWIIKIGKA